MVCTRFLASCPGVAQDVWLPFVTGIPAIDAAMHGPDCRTWFAPDF
ncbi:hypothetical protein B4099_1064 [Heyndrickxia coagulans]|uniref:Uncharacterized protein n=1 Tax=Heyndrickxia coagulans TaxID=1398 RepID=A0A150KG73_HEYCO|nr:hypothetical protein B4099_1064 [Heyndrickxia coagulans]